MATYQVAVNILAGICGSHCYKARLQTTVVKVIRDNLWRRDHFTALIGVVVRLRARISDASPVVFSLVASWNF